MENNSNKMRVIKVVGVVVLLAIVVGAGIYAWRLYERKQSEEVRRTAPMSLELTETPFVEGVLNPPAGFPSSIPLESDSIVTSTLTTFPDRGATQRAVMYHSKETTESKYSEYSSYLEAEGYAVEEIKREDGTIFLGGQKEGETISIVINIWEEFTRVYITHLSFLQ